MIVKVCGVRSPEVAEVAVAAGADWIGIVFVAASPRFAADDVARRVAGAMRGRADVVGVFVDASAAECDDAAARYGLAAVQVHGHPDREMATACSVPVIPAINVRVAADAYLLDWWSDQLVMLDGAPSPGGLPGGTGHHVALSVAADVARHRPVLLAGGLGPDNVGEAIAAVRPAGVDASSRLERAPGEKDPGLVSAFVCAARAAADALPAWVP